MGASQNLSQLAVPVCSAMQNLREAIAGYRGRLMHEGNDVKRNALLQVVPRHLPRSAHSMLPAHAGMHPSVVLGVSAVSCTLPGLVMLRGGPLFILWVVCWIEVLRKFC